MRRVAIIAYHFPPSGGAGVQRPLKFAKFLPRFGWEPVIFTGPASSTATRDVSLADELPPETRVVRGQGPEPGAGSTWRRRAQRWLRVRSDWSRWWFEQVTTADVQGADVLLATMSPFDSAEATAALSLRLGIPWVADLRDPWALDEMFAYPTRFHRRLELRRMGSSLASASAIIMNTPEAASAMRAAFPNLSKIPVAVLPNGYDATDFSQPARRNSDEIFRIVHAGTLHASGAPESRRARVPRRLRGGTIAGVDVLPRSHVFLVEAVKELLATDHRLVGRVELHLAGGSGTVDAPPFVVNHGYLAHRRAVRLLEEADLLFLPMHDVAPGYRTRIVPAKTYEYLATGRPLLAAVPPGDAQDLVRRAPNAHVCGPTDVRMMTEILRREIDSWRDRGVAPSTDNSVLLSPYERAALTARLADVLDRTIEKVPAQKDHMAA